MVLEIQGLVALFSMLHIYAVRDAWPYVAYGVAGATLPHNYTLQHNRSSGYWTCMDGQKSVAQGQVTLTLTLTQSMMMFSDHVPHGCCCSAGGCSQRCGLHRQCTQQVGFRGICILYWIHLVRYATRGIVRMPNPSSMLLCLNS